MAKSSKKGAYGTSWLVSVILALIPVTNIILGIVHRAKKGNTLGIILNIILAPVFYVVDLITVIFANKLVLLA